MAQVRGKQIASGEIDTLQLATEAVTTAKIADLNVTTGKLALLSVDTGQLAAEAVTDAKVDSTVIVADGSHAFTGDQAMGSNKITGLADGTASGDAVNKGQLDAAVAGISWQEPAALKDYIGTRTVAEINSLGTPAAGHTVVASDAGTPTEGTSDALAAGDIAEFDGTSWKNLITNSGGFPPDGTRLLVHTETVTLVSPLTDGADEGKYADFGGASLTPTLTSPADGDGILINEEAGVNENKAYVYDGAVPTGDWIQFSGLGLVTAGAGLTKTGNTLDVGSGTGITVNADSIEFDAEAVDGNGLTGSTNTLSVDSDTETGGNIQGANVTANGVGVDINAIAGTGLEADGSANLRLATQGTGIGGGNGSTLSFDATAADGNGLTGSGSTLTVTADTVATDNSEALVIGANGISINGDVIDIDYAETNYTPATTGTGVDVNDLAAHLEGIDDALGSIGGAGTPVQESITTEAITGTDTALAETLTSAPTGATALQLYLNGVLQVQQGTGTTGEPGFDAASSDYSISSQTITWLASSGTAVDMETSDVLVAVYEA
jgi:hypothetical protein